MSPSARTPAPQEPHPCLMCDATTHGPFQFSGFGAVMPAPLPGGRWWCPVKDAWPQAPVHVSSGQLVCSRGGGTNESTVSRGPVSARHANPRLEDGRHAAIRAAVQRVLTLLCNSCRGVHATRHTTVHCSGTGCRGTTGVPCSCPHAWRRSVEAAARRRRSGETGKERLTTGACPASARHQKR